MSAVLLGPERNEMFRGASAVKAASASSIRATTEAAGTIDTWTSAIRPGRSVFPPRAGLDDRPRFGDRGLRRAKTGGDRSVSPADLRPRREVERPERDAVSYTHLRAHETR